MAAGIALVREAGGFVTDLEGRDITLAAEGILAGNEAIHRDMLRTLRETHGARDAASAVF